MNSSTKEKKSVLQTTSLWAVFFVLLINVVFFTCDPTKAINAAKFPSAHTWQWWRTQSYNEGPKAPDVVLLGSSLIQIPIATADADYLDKDLDAVKHPHTIYMHDKLSKSGLPDLTCLNFGLPGGMVSDDYMVARALFTDERKPKVAVLCVTLRDLIESHVPYAAATSPYQYFTRFFDNRDILSISMPLSNQVDYWVNHYCALYGKRFGAQVATTAYLKDAISPLLSPIVAQSPVDSTDLKTTNLAAKLKSTAEENEFILPKHAYYQFEQNDYEYASRFKSAHENLFADEAKFLDKLMALCADKGVRLLVVNMPLTKYNMMMMPAGSYDKYMQVLKTDTVAHNTDFIDLNDQKKFDTSYFRDTAHMNSEGGIKLIDELVAKIKTTDDLKLALLNGSNEKNSTAIAGKSDLTR